MRVCLISREYPPDTGWGGVGAYTYQIAHGLAERGHFVDVISLSAAKGSQKNLATLPANPGSAESPDASARINVHRVEWENMLDELNLFLIYAPSTHYVIKSGIALWRKFAELHAENPFDVVEVPEHLGAGIFNALTGVVPLVVKLHTPHSKFISERFHNVLPTLDNQLICMMERISMLEADLLCSPSRNLAEFCAQDMNLNVDDIFMARNPVDTARFHPAGMRAIDESDEFNVVFVGRLEERKGIQYLIDAMPLIVKEVPNVRLIVVGADTNTAPGGTSYLAEMKRRVSVSGCADKVRFVAHVPLAEIPNYYRSAHVSVVPSLYENAPYTCIEAMSCGRPVVVTDAGGTREYVQHDEWGYIVPSRDAEALATSVIKLLKDGRLRERFGKNARAFVEEHCSRQSITRRMEQLYATAIERHSARQESIYRKSADKILADTLELLCATDQAIFDLLYARSVSFRLTYWWRFLKKRPQLCIATLAMHAAKYCGAHSVAGRLERLVAGKQAPRYQSTMNLATVSAIRKAAAAGHEQKQGHAKAEPLGSQL